MYFYTMHQHWVKISQYYICAILTCIIYFNPVIFFFSVCELVATLALREINFLTPYISNLHLGLKNPINSHVQLDSK